MQARIVAFDWLRVLAFGLLIPYHVGMIFVTWNFHIKNTETSEFLEVIMVMVNRWRLPLLFFISGAGTYFSLRNRKITPFLWERTQRLLFPLIVGMLVIVPPQIYYEKLQKGERLTYGEFYQQVFEFVPYPQGSFSWHHLWFIAYLYVFVLLLIPFWKWITTHQGQKILNSFSQKFHKNHHFYYLMIPIFFINITLIPFFPTTHNLHRDWANFTASLYIFLIGFLIASQPKFLTQIVQIKKNALFWAIGCYSLLIYLWKSEILISRIEKPIRQLIYISIDTGLEIFSLTAIIGYAYAYLTYTNTLLRYCNRAVYAFYILHQTVLIVIGYYVIQWQFFWLYKFLIIVGMTFLFCWLIYEVIKTNPFTRFLFGTK